MSAYEPPGFAAPIDLDLSKNEGRPTITELSLDEAQLASLTSRYPDTRRLAGLVAERHGLGTERVLVTAGGDDALFRCFLRARGPVVATTPSFEMIRNYAAQLDLPLVEVPWWDDDFPLGDFLDVDAAMAVVVSPNNPTGNVLTPADLRKIADAFPLVVLDAAYTEFAQEDLTPVAVEAGNVVTLRTLSKAFGLAGLRVGYLLGPEEIVAELRGYGSPYSISALSAALAADVLERGPTGARRFVDTIVAERARLVDVLTGLGAEPLESQGNFVLATRAAPGWLVPAAATLGIALRQFPDHPELEGCVRIGLPGDAVDFERLITTLRVVLAPEALLFDMDGVIADVAESFRAAIVQTAAHFGVVVSTGDISAAKARGNASDDWELTRGLCAASGVNVSFDEMRAQFEKIYQGTDEVEGLKTRERLIPDVALLERLAARLPLGIVTARPRKDADEFLDRFGVAGVFSVVVAREDAPSKPDPAPVALAMEKLGVSRAWMAGDTSDDVMAAMRAGALPIGVAVAGDDVSPLSVAARIIRSIDEIEELLDVTQV